MWETPLLLLHYSPAQAVEHVQLRGYVYSHTHLERLLCALILISRLGDIGSTYLITPKLKLEANPILRKLGWWFAIASVLV